MEQKDSNSNAGNRKQPSPLTDYQLKNLTKFLRDLDYKKEEIVSFIVPGDSSSADLNNLIDLIEEESQEARNLGIVLQKKGWRILIKYILRIFGLEWFINKLSEDIYIKFEKTISQGQAEALINRILDIKLLSSGRTQLYELRKKIKRYEKFLTHFGKWAELYDYTLKIVILGFKQFQLTKLVPLKPLPGLKSASSIIGVDFYQKPIEISNSKVNLQLWDISVEEPNRFLIQPYCKGTSGAILAYDKSDRESFELIKEIYNQLKEATNLLVELKESKGVYIDMPVTLIGLGEDKNVSSEEGQSLARELNISGYVEISEVEPEKFVNILSSLSLRFITAYQNALKKHPHKYRFKVAVVGDGGVGKTSLIKRFTGANFNLDYVKTIGAQYSVYDKEIEGDLVRVLFWDIAGSDSFHFLRPNFFKNSRAVIFVYSLEDTPYGKKSFDHVVDWHKDFIINCGDIPFIIIGNKNDLIDEDKIDDSKVQELFKNYNFLGHYIASARTGQGVDDAFNKIIEKLYNQYKT
ncbi:MAG: GTP-binding protein [Promethearchaeota archaeon]